MATSLTLDPIRQTAPGRYRTLDRMPHKGPWWCNTPMTNQVPVLCSSLGHADFAVSLRIANEKPILGNFTCSLQTDPPPTEQDVRPQASPHETIPFVRHPGGVRGIAFAIVLYCSLSK